jgi:hypothetical protein
MVPKNGWRGLWRRRNRHIGWKHQSANLGSRAEAERFVASTEKKRRRLHGA